jgi:hypothetical protein
MFASGMPARPPGTGRGVGERPPPRSVGLRASVTRRPHRKPLLTKLRYKVSLIGTESARLNFPEKETSGGLQLDYRQHAAECVVQSQRSSDLQTKAFLLRLAQAWIDLAEYVTRVPLETTGHQRLTN